MVFKTLQLENYQAHKNTSVNLTSGLNIIIGESDTGKSSILRALRKLIRDVPSGKDHINKDSTSMKISLTIVDDIGHEYTIIRQVTPSKNLYYLNEQEFGGFGREIPKEIQDALEMFLIELENGEKIDLHFFDQHDMPFMVAKGAAGIRSKLLGRIAGLHTLDRGIVNVNKDIRAGNSTLKIKFKNKDELQQNVDNAKDTTKGYALHAKCKTLLQKNIKDLAILTELIRLQEHLLTVVNKGKALKKELDLIPEVNVDFQKLRNDIQRLKTLQKLQNDLNDVDIKITQFSTISNISIDFNAMYKNIQKLSRLQTCQAELKIIDSQIISANVIDFDVKIDEAQKEWTTILTKLKICPVCKQSTVNMKTHCI